MPLIWQISLLFLISYLLLSCQSPFFPHSVYSYFFSPPYFAPSELEMKSHGVWVTRRWTQSRVRLPGDLQDQLWSWVCWCCPGLKTELLWNCWQWCRACFTSARFHWVLPSLGICVTWGSSGLSFHIPGVARVTLAGKGVIRWTGAWLQQFIINHSVRKEETLRKNVSIMIMLSIKCP